MDLCEEDSIIYPDSDNADGPLGGEDANSCRICQKKFETRSMLNVHYTHTHRDKPLYECNFCGMVFNIKRELATHRRIHNGEPLHLCLYCGKAFGTKQLLKKHHVWHTGHRDYVCPRCGKAFYQKGHLTQHMMIHTGGRPHLCELCGKTFIFKFDLNRHLKIHAERNEDGNFCPDDPKPGAEANGAITLDQPGAASETLAITAGTENALGIAANENFYDTDSPDLSSIAGNSTVSLMDESGGVSSAIFVDEESTADEHAGAVVGDDEVDSFTAKLAEIEREKQAKSNLLARQIIMASLKSKCEASAAARAAGSKAAICTISQAPLPVTSSATLSTDATSQPMSSASCSSSSATPVSSAGTTREQARDAPPAGRVSSDATYCSSCDIARAELAAAKTEIRALRATVAKQRTRLTIREKELKTTRLAVGRVQDLANGLLASCADFDAALMRNQSDACSQLYNLG